MGHFNYEMHSSDGEVRLQPIRSVDSDMSQLPFAANCLLILRAYKNKTKIGDFLFSVFLINETRQSAGDGLYHCFISGTHDVTPDVWQSQMHTRQGACVRAP